MSGQLSDRAASRLVAAGRLLQAPPAVGGWGQSIRRQEGESYPQAVLRSISALPPVDQARLRGLVDWVEDYEAVESERGG
jgi:hypothetical protein